MGRGFTRAVGIPAKTRVTTPPAHGSAERGPNAYRSPLPLPTSQRPMNRPLFVVPPSGGPWGESALGGRDESRTTNPTRFLAPRHIRCPGFGSSQLSAISAAAMLPLSHGRGVSNTRHVTTQGTAWENGKAVAWLPHSTGDGSAEPRPTPLRLSLPLAASRLPVLPLSSQLSALSFLRPPAPAGSPGK